MLPETAECLDLGFLIPSVAYVRTLSETEYVFGIHISLLFVALLGRAGRRFALMRRKAAGLSGYQHRQN